MNILKELILNQLVKIPLVKNIAKKRHSTGRNNDAKQVKNIFDKLTLYTDFKEKKALELGPGQTFGVLKEVRNAKASYVCAVDIMNYVENIPEGVEYKHYDGKILPFSTDYFDVIWSWTVLEHVRHPQVIIPETYRVLKNGGVAIHHIDLTDHFNYTWQKDELTFNCLRYSTLLWNLMTWNRSNYVNRLRLSNWINLFEKVGFEILHTETTKNKKIENLYTEKKISYLKKLSTKDASTASLFIVVRKQHDFR